MHHASYGMRVPCGWAMQSTAREAWLRGGPTASDHLRNHAVTVCVACGIMRHRTADYMCRSYMREGTHLPHPTLSHPRASTTHRASGIVYRRE